MAKKKRVKKGKIQTDAEGQFVWETYFVGGKQKRRKVRVIGGERVDHVDDDLLRHADDLALHQAERWDFIEQGPPEERQQAESESTRPEQQVIPLSIDELEVAFDYLSSADSSFEFEDRPTFIFLDRNSGKLAWVEGEDEAEKCRFDINLLELPEDLHEGRDYAMMEDFVATLEDPPVRDKLARAIRGKGAFRRFRDSVNGSGDVELKYAWNWFQSRRRREHIVEWLETCRIQPQWNRDIFKPPPLPDKRSDLLKAVLRFVRDARDVPGVRRIALLGSLTTAKAIPKDVDLLVEVTDDDPLDRLARVRRQLSGRTMQTGDCCGADVFLCNPQGDYLGRICQWKKCAPGIRQSCPARHCGRRPFICDDLQHVKLNRALLAAPPLDLWPEWVERTKMPEDLRTELAELHEPCPES